MSKLNIPKQGIPTVASAYADILGHNSENQIIEIDVEKITEVEQAFKIHEDVIESLAESIKKDGQLEPCIVTAPNNDGFYELLSGRHRRRACIKADLKTVKCIIKSDLSESEKRKIINNSNLERNNDYLPSELAYAYKEKAELEGGIKKIADEANISRKKIYRYIRLTYLINPLLQRVDSGVIPLIAAVELSYLSESYQKKLFEFLLNHSDCKITTDVAREIKDNPDNLEDIFFHSAGIYDVDNLSTFDTENNIESDNIPSEEEILSSVSETFEENYDVDNLSIKEKAAIQSLAEVDIETQKFIVKKFIELSHIDKKIVKEFCNTNEVLNYIKEFFILTHRGGADSNCLFQFKSKFEIEIDSNGKSYTLSYKELDELAREYIRHYYTTEQVIKIIKSK